jgi:hypothetical protein
LMEWNGMEWRMRASFRTDLCLLAQAVGKIEFHGSTPTAIVNDTP